MGKPSALLFQSKLLCFSLLYLFAALFLALYTSLSPTRCLLRSSPFDPLQSPLFSYPPSYGEHKYALPTARPSCSSPVLFSDYLKAVKEVGDLCTNSSSSSSPPPLRYKQGKDDSFGGSFSDRERFSYFDHHNDSVELPCGFFMEFPISKDDREAMEKCNGVVVASAIFNDHDKIRQPRGLGSQTLASVCFFMFVDSATANVLENHNLIPRDSRAAAAARKIGAWRIVEVNSERLYENPAMNGVIPKHLVHRLFPNSKFSIWIDAKLQMAVDPVLLVHSLLVREGADMAVSKHPYYVNTMEEAMATARWKKWWDVDSLKKQMESYCENGLQPWSPNKLPYTSDVPDSALILRRHTPASNLFSCLLFNELHAFNPRDQLAFAYVRDLMNPKPKLHMFDVEVFEQVVLEYRHNLKSGGAAAASAQQRTKRAAAGSPEPSGDGSSGGGCEKYLEEMWA